MSAAQHASPHYILLLLFTVNVFLGIASNFEVSRFNRLFPNLNVMYTLKPVRHMHPALAGTCTGANCPSVATVRDAVAEGVAIDTTFTALQVSKYKMGCYGDLAAFKTKQGYATYKALGPDAKADTLNLAQHAAGGFAKSSACKCIDDVVKELVKDTTTMTGLYTAIDTTLATEYPKIKDGNDYTGAYGVVNTQIAIPTDLAADIPSDDKAELNRHVAEFCSSTGAPQFAYKYEGVVDTSLIALIGQLLVIVGIAMEYVMRWKDDTKKQVEDENSGITVPNIIIAALGLVSALLVILLFVYFPDNYKTDDMSIVGYRGAEKTKIERFQQVIMSGAAIFVVINALIQLIAGASILYKSDSKEKNPATLMGSYAMLFAYDMQQAIGWTLVIAAFAIQTNIKHIGTIAAFVFVIAGAGALQYCSNMLKTLYNKTLAKTSQADITALQTMVNPEGDGKGTAKLADSAGHRMTAHLEHLRGLLRFIGWGRLFIFVSVFILSVFGITLARESTVGSHVQSLYEGRLLYALVAFLLGTIGVDVVLEIVPLQFIYADDASGDKKLSDAYAYNIRYYLISIYFLWLNLSTLSLFRYETKDEWQVAAA